MNKTDYMEYFSDLLDMIESDEIIIDDLRSDFFIKNCDVIHTSDREFSIDAELDYIKVSFSMMKNDNNC